MSHRDFIEKWKQSQGREDSNAKPFLSDISYEIDLPRRKILERLVNLNTERHLEEQSGLICRLSYCK